MGKGFVGTLRTIVAGCRYLFGLVRAGDPYLWRRTVSFLRIGAFKLRYAFARTGGKPVVADRWDALIILDACRYDSFKKLNTFKGRLRKRRAMGSDTSEFLARTFTKRHDDIVYITGNPKIMADPRLKRDPPFHRVEHVWLDGWDDRYDTVLPDPVIARTAEARRRFPGKRLIIHLIQPHYPFVGPSRERLRRLAKAKGRAEAVNRRIADYVRYGGCDPALVRRAYEENVVAGLRAVERLLPLLEGRVVVTADHGDLLGEHGLFFHFSRVYLPGLVEVPWLVLTGGAKRSGRARAGLVESLRI